MRLLLSWILNAISLAILVYFIAPLFHIGVIAHNLGTLLIAALVFGIVNAIVRPIATLLSIPLIVVTLGLFLFVLNALLLWLVGAIVPGFHVDGFLGGVLGSNLARHYFLDRQRDRRPPGGLAAKKRSSPRTRRSTPFLQFCRLAGEPHEKG